MKRRMKHLANVLNRTEYLNELRADTQLPRRLLIILVCLLLSMMNNFLVLSGDLGRSRKFFLDKMVCLAVPS